MTFANHRSPPSVQYPEYLRRGPREIPHEDPDARPSLRAAQPRQTPPLRDPLGPHPVARFLSTLLFEVKPVDLPLYLGVALVLSAVAAVAALVPARRATRIDPLEALRHELGRRRTEPLGRLVVSLEEGGGRCTT